jgi:hypothetical protein
MEVLKMEITESDVGPDVAIWRMETDFMRLLK